MVGSSIGFHKKSFKISLTDDPGDVLNDPGSHLLWEEAKQDIAQRRGRGYHGVALRVVREQLGDRGDIESCYSQY